MAIRFDAVGDTLGRTASIPSNTACTYMMWAVRDADTGGVLEPYAFVSDASFLDGFSVSLDRVSEKFTIEVYDAGALVRSVDAAGMPAQGDPHCVFVRCSGTGTDLLTAGYRLASDSAFTTISTTLGTLDAASDVNFGGVAATYWQDGRKWSVKVWDRALSDAEILVESFFDRVMYPASLNFHWPLHNASDTADRSGNGRDATVGGTLTTGDSLSNLWKPRPKFWFPQGSTVTSRPSAITAGTWTDEAGGVLTAADVNDNSDATGARDVAGASYDPLPFTADTPLTAASQTFYFRGRDIAAGKQVRQVIYAADGTTVVATGAWHTMTGTLATYSDVLTPTATAYKGEIQTQAA